MYPGCYPYSFDAAAVRDLLEFHASARTVVTYPAASLLYLLEYRQGRIAHEFESFVYDWRLGDNVDIHSNTALKEQSLCVAPFRRSDLGTASVATAGDGAAIY